MRRIIQTLKHTAPWLLILFMAPALSHEGATGIVKKRMDSMESMKEETKLLTDMAKGKRPLDPLQIQRSAAKIHELSQHIAMQFPEDSLHRPTNALPAIWQHWQRFEDYSVELSNEADVLKQLAKQKNVKESRGQIIKLGKVCVACHKDFREKRKTMPSRLTLTKAH
ncbi:MAG: cytochrome c [Motiliproteus sp.]